MSLGAESLDVLASGNEPDPRRRRAVAAVVALLVVALAVGLLLDRRSRQGEYEDLVACRQEAFAAVDAARDATAPTAEYVRPSLSFDTGLSNDGLYRMVAQAAGPAVPELNNAETACRAVEVRSWHTAQRDGRTVLLAYVGAEAELYRRTVDDGSAFFGPNPTADERAAASTAVDDARPW